MYRVAVFACIILAFGVATSRAGPCTSDILEKAVNEPNSPYAPTARQSIGAQLSRQPTPSSVARAEGQADSTYQAALDRARALDNQGNPDCAGSKTAQGADRHAMIRPGLRGILGATIRTCRKFSLCGHRWCRNTASGSERAASRGLRL